MPQQKYQHTLTITSPIKQIITHINITQQKHKK